MRPKRTIKPGRLAGIPVALHPICLVYLPLAVLLLALGPLAAQPANGPLTKWLLACVTVGLMAMSVCLHESGHLLTAVLCKLPIRQTIFYPFGGIVQMGTTPIPFLPFVLMVLAGPFFSLAQAIIWLCIWLGTDFTVSLWLAQFNVAMALLNLLPAARLDGGHLLKLLGHSFLPEQWAQLVGFLTSVYLPMGFTLAGGAAILFGLILPNVVWGLAGFLLVLTGLLLQGELDYVMLPCTPEQIKELDRTSAAELYTKLSVHTALEKVQASRVNGRLAQNKTISPLSFHADTNGPSGGREKPGQKPPPTLQPWLVYPTTSLLKALHNLDSARASTLLMVEDSQIIGTISHDQILQYQAAQELRAPPRSANLFMLLKPNTAVEESLYLS